MGPVKVRLAVAVNGRATFSFFSFFFLTSLYILRHFKRRVCHGVIYPRLDFHFQILMTRIDQS